MENFATNPEQKIDVIGIPISQSKFSVKDFVLKLESIVDRTENASVTFVNPLAVRLSQRDISYAKHLARHSFVFCDGIGMVLAARSLGVSIERISFDATSLAPPVFDLCQQRSLPVVLIGGAPGVATSSAAVFKDKYPGLSIAGVYSGFGDDPNAGIKQALSLDYCVVILGLGSPLQEKLSIRLIDDGFKGISFTCGGYFDQVGNQDSYYPDFVNRLNIRFLYRLIKEPRRLWKRYFLEYGNFFIGWLHASLIRTIKRDLRLP